LSTQADVPNRETGAGNGTQTSAIVDILTTEYTPCMQSVVPELEIICN
jgi:hypothetical protein